MLHATISSIEPVIGLIIKNIVPSKGPKDEQPSIGTLRRNSCPASNSFETFRK